MKKNRIIFLITVCVAVVIVAIILGFIFYKETLEQRIPTKMPEIGKLFGSTEEGKKIRQLYLDYLNREPTESEIAGWIMKGEDISKIEESIKNSNEYTCIDFFKQDQTVNSTNLENAFSNLDKNLLKIDPNIKLSPTPGYVITTSILSNSKNKIVYSEISDCIKLANTYCAAQGSTPKKTCDWKYNVFVKDLNTGVINKIYSYPTKTTFIDKLKIQKAVAGGCPIVWFPIAWSNNDQKIILRWGNPTVCGSGGGPDYSTQTINIDGTNMNPLATYETLFLNNYAKVIYVGASDKSPTECGPAGQRNWGKIIMKNIESGQETILLEEPNSAYSTLKADISEKILTYTVKKVKEVNGCSEEDKSVPEQEKQIVLP